MPAQRPHADLAKINYPSDRLTVKDLRLLFPENFDRVDDRGNPQSPKFVQYDEEAEFLHPTRHAGKKAEELLINRVSDLQWLLTQERRVAVWAFNLALGRPADDKEDYQDAQLREEEKDLLAEDLVKYRLASGPQHAAQLIREIESQAAAQGKAFGSPSRP